MTIVGWLRISGIRWVRISGTHNGRCIFTAGAVLLPAGFSSSHQKCLPSHANFPSAKNAAEGVALSPYSTFTQLLTKSLPCFPYETRRGFEIVTVSFLPLNSI